MAGMDGGWGTNGRYASGSNAIPLRSRATAFGIAPEPDKLEDIEEEAAAPHEGAGHSVAKRESE